VTTRAFGSIHRVRQDAPKGTVHVHSSLIQTAELYAQPILGIRENDVVFSAAKLFFAYGLGNALTFPLAVGLRPC
jgi:benzoate-CoA ligase